ncbi:SigE family RNA polymerase sigma factor [Micromonospora saelicesensis]|uniref:ECF RNA polymerase sigma factor SigM n=1 Tax=Micromonospora saelicesensis TaxID=285676 RepID=A0A1C4VB19_9ACTN|nr:SigE family RNA polymerase sigma factor [Micromonospora saelicesensis]RAN97266.1 ECF RNA polymerase sigma factor SigM [Micromonospora saelicesensis]RAO44226.1 ECF RNA polymerase sigma factor SigM [Micromonospora saelicesensis]RAO49748.1 ECF RNA polymerase sigma factor SigM [Micromonospora saelicesensis]SCE81223.1 RNA polymerase sigma-70 factor, ECF subfamily [Micromonospora saelicesensis]
MDRDDGFEEFYRASRHRVVTVLYALGGDIHEAQDAAQEAYVRAWQRWRRISEYDDPEAWVHVVGHRLLQNRWRKIRNGITAHRRNSPVTAVGPPSENTVALVAALRQLPRDQREAIVLYHLADLSVADIATRTAAPVGTVKARLARGRRALAPLLGTTLPEEVSNA